MTTPANAPTPSPGLKWLIAYFGLWFILIGMVDVSKTTAKFASALSLLILTTSGILMLPKSLNNLGLLTPDQAKKLGF